MHLLVLAKSILASGKVERRKRSFVKASLADSTSGQPRACQGAWALRR